MADRTVTILATLQDAFTPNLSKLQAGIGKVVTGMQGLQSAIAPLTGAFAAFAAGAAGLAGASKALEAAKQAADAEARLLASLKGRTGELKKILDLSGKIQNSSRLEDETLQEGAALLINMGVSTDDLEKSLRAAVDTSAALGLEFDTVVRDIGLLATGENARMIPRFVTELKDMAEAGTLAAEGIDFLNSKFGGTEQKIALTTFGRITQLEHQIGDEMERIGRVLAELKLKAMEGLQKIITTIADKMESPEFKGAMQAIATGLVPALVLIAKVVGVIVGVSLLGKMAAMLTGIITAVASIASGIAPILIPLGVIVGLVLLIPGALEGILGFAQQIADFVTGTVEETKAIFKEVGEGKLTVQDLFDFAMTRARQFWISFKATVINPVIEFGKAIGRIVSGSFTGAVASLVKVFFKMIQGVELGFKHTIKAVLKLAQDAVNLFVNYWNDVAETTGLFDPMEFASFGDNFSTELSDFTAEGLAMVDEALRQAADDVFNAIPEAQNAVAVGLAKANEEIVQLNQDMLDRLDASRTEQAEKEKARIRSVVDETKKANLNILSEIRSREEELSKARFLGSVDFSNVTPDQVREIARSSPSDDQKNLVIASLNNQFKEGALEVREYLDLLREISQFDTQKQIGQLDAQIAHYDEIIGHLQAIEVKNEDSEEGAKARLEIDGKINEALQKAVNLQTQRNDLALKLAATEEQIRQSTLSLADAQLQKANDAKSAFETRRSEILSGVESGALFPGDARTQNEAALTEFRSKIEEVRESLATLAFEAPNAAAQINEVGTKVAELQTKTELGAVPQEGGFFQGLSTGFETTMQQMGDLDQVGAQVGSSLASNMAAGLVTLFLEGKAAFKDFLASFLAGIAQMILQMIIARAIMTTLGIPPIGINSGGYIQGDGTLKRARGGPVFGPRINRDVVPAMLTPGEFVINRDAVEHYGAGYMFALNRRKVARTPISAPGSIHLNDQFNSGGQVGGPAVAGPSRAVIVGDEQAMDRLLAGGHGAMMRWMHRNSSALKSIMQERAV